MFVIAGLGNPGKRYAGTRHNVGSILVERFARELSQESGSRGAQEPSWGKHGHCLVQSVSIADKRCLMVLPQKFMNESGSAVGEVLRFYQLSPESLVVVHDELDLLPGEVRIKFGGSSAGNRGVEDIIRVLGSSNFYRVRVGIGHPRAREEQSNQVGVEEVRRWVLTKPSGDDARELEQGISRAITGVRLLLSEGLEAAQRETHAPRS